MTNVDRILKVLSQANGVLCDDCISRIANVFPRQQVNAIAAKLFTAKRIFRKDGLACVECRRIKKGSAPLNRPPVPQDSELSGTVPEIGRQTRTSRVNPFAVQSHEGFRAGDLNLARPWHWEGNVQTALRDHMVREGWRITHFANTESKESGIDLGVSKDSRAILFEVKGYPTTVYDYGPKLGQSKPTTPSSQARQWYAHALLGIMRMREQFPSNEIALCFPDFPTYRRLIDGTRSSLQLLDVAVYLVMDDLRVLVLIDPSTLAERE